MSIHTALADIQSHAKRMMTVLELSGSPVGVRFLSEDDELPEGARELNQYRYCQALMLARRGEHVLLDGRGIACPAAAAAFGFRPEATQQGCGVMPPHEITGGPTIGIDVGQYLVTKVRAAQCHASQNPPFSGDPETEAERLACHEYFVLAFPALESVNTHELFDQKLVMEVHHERA